MFFKRRWFRVLTIVLAVVLFVGYFAFSTFVFPPHEGDFEHDVSALIPRDVDFFVAKADLRGDFNRFPELAVADDLGEHPIWGSFLVSPDWWTARGWMARKLELPPRKAGDDPDADDLDTAVEQIETELKALPLGLGLLDVIGGRDLALAGYFRGAAFANANWAAYGRVNWAGKLAYAALGYPGMIGLEDQGLSVEEERGVYRVSGGELERPLWVTRIRDVIVVSTDPELTSSARELDQVRGQGSLLASADYNDNIATVPRSDERNEIELIVDMRDLLPNLEHEGPWPDPDSHRFVTAFAGRIFQAPSCKKVMGVAGFHGGLQMDLFGGFASEKISDACRAIYGKKGFGHEHVLEKVAKLAPADTGLFVYLHGPVDVLLKELFASMEPAMRDNLETAFRQTGEYDSLDQLVDHVSAALHDRLALIVRKYDYPEEVGGPQHDDTPVFLAALVGWYSDEERLVGLRDLIGSNPEIFGLQAAPGMEGRGYYTNTVQGISIHEFHNPFVPGSGVIATTNTREGHFYVANNHHALAHLRLTLTQGAREGSPSLADYPPFRALLERSLESANVLVWINPRELAPTLSKQAAHGARMDATSGLDENFWRPIRREVESEIMAESFPSRSQASLDGEERDQFDTLFLSEMDRRRDDILDELAPQLLAARERRIGWGEGVSAALMLLQLNPKQFRISLRTVVPLD